MFFTSLKSLPPDSILGLMSAFRQDLNPDKVDLSVGIYRESSGETPVMRAVRRAEAEIINEQVTKAYIPPIGVEGFRAGVAELVFGDETNALQPRTACVQTVGGCGALRVAGGLYKRAVDKGWAYVSAPTWGNHFGLLGGAGLNITEYPYYDSEHHALRIDQMLNYLRRAPPRSLIVLQVGCHNPSGADPSDTEWDAILDVIEARSLLPLFDLAYQGMGTSIDADAAPVRKAAKRLSALMVAVSTSKNFGLYRERTGALLAITETPSQVEMLESQMQDIARGMYSMSPAHGALIVDRILDRPELRADWRDELEAMRLRIIDLRRQLQAALRTLRPDLDSGWLVEQRGMFSLLGIDRADIDRLRSEHHIYMVGDSRINIAGLNDHNLDMVASAIAPLMK
ncbi:MAG: aspartate/tyrosine/aromatic aminotransferase [Gammaproteobacteria bacterium]|nr:aspartate/tyrosine/aromatic aminotransferase [Gammaproteobacteria bacterium]